jgi:hypothetical protein
MTLFKTICFSPGRAAFRRPTQEVCVTARYLARATRTSLSRLITCPEGQFPHRAFRFKSPGQVPQPYCDETTVRAPSLRFCWGEYPDNLAAPAKLRRQKFQAAKGILRTHAWLRDTAEGDISKEA